MGGNYSRAKPVPKRKASWDYHCVIAIDVILSMPDKVGLNTYYIAKNTVNVAVAIAARENSYPNSDRKSTRLNSSHANISYAVFCLKKKKIKKITILNTTI